MTDKDAAALAVLVAQLYQQLMAATEQVAVLEQALRDAQPETSDPPAP